MNRVFRQLLAIFLALSLVFPSSLMAQTNIRPDVNAQTGKRPDMTTAPNGVPVVNIADPSKSGLSHNQYRDFSVGRQGAILNNSTQDGITQLGGAVLKNPNLKSGSAQTILNEVTGASRSNIQGYIEVHGRKADVILANPNGVTINGGGFLNTGRATVTTGRPDVDAAGVLRGFDVRQGDVRVEGGGINASNISGFDIVSRAAEINAEIYAQDLSIVTGRNRYDPANRSVTPLDGSEGQRPRVSIDSSALGGMYAGRITLTSTEKGVGVNLEGVMQSTGDLAITSEGRLVARALKSEADLSLASTSGKVKITEMALAGKNLSATGKEVVLRDAGASAGGNLALQASEAVIVTGPEAYAVAGAQASLNAPSLAVKAGAAVSGKEVRIKADSVRIKGESYVASTENTGIEAQSISLDGQSFLSGSDIALNATAAIKLTDGAYLAARGSADLDAPSIMLEGAAIVAESGLRILGQGLALVNSGLTGGLAQVDAQSVRLKASSLSAGSTLNIFSQSINLLDSVLAGQSVALAAADRISAAGASFVQGDDSTAIESGSLAAEKGAVLSGGKLFVKADDITLDAATAQAAARLELEAGALANNGGALYSNADIFVRANSVQNRGEVSAAGSVALSADSFENESGRVLAGDALSIRAGSFASRGGSSASLDSFNLEGLAGLIYAGGNLEFSGNSFSMNGGLIGSERRLELNGASLDFGSGAALYSGSATRMRAGNAINLDNSAFSVGGGLDLAAQSLNLRNSSSVLVGGQLSADLKANLAVGSASSLAAYSGLQLGADNLSNYGLIYSGGDGVFNLGNTLANLDGADILAEGSLWFAGREPGGRLALLHNRSANIESLNGGISVSALSLFNEGKAPVTRRVADGYDYKIVGWSGRNGYGSTEDPYDNPYSPCYAYGPEGQKNYLRNRDHLVKSEAAVFTYVQETGRLYGLSTQLLGKFEGLQDWWEYSYDAVETPASPASILAGGDMILNVGELRNTYSTLSAGGDLAIAAEKLTNQGLELSRYTDIERAFISTGKRGTYKIDNIQCLYFNLSEVYDVVPAVISAAGNLTLNVAETFDNSSMKAGEEYLGKAGGTPAFSGFAVTGNLDSDKLRRFHPQDEPPLGVDPGKLPVLKLPSPEGVFRLAENPNHNYLIETNPALTNFGKFYGSEYFLSKIGYDLHYEQTKLLGDAYYETRLVREQMLTQAGTRYLFAGVTDDSETMRRLMDNAAAEGLGLGLAVGVALTPEQIQGLTKDIIWLEEMDYNGRSVLVPRLYLCEATLANAGLRGAIIAGNDVSVNHSGSAPLANSGLITGNRVRIASTADILNRGGDILGKTALIARSDGSIINRSGSLGGGEVGLFAAKDIRLETAVEQKDFGGKYADIRTRTGQVAQVKASGNLLLQAGENIALAGARVEGGGQTALDAGGDVTLGSLEILSAQTSKRGYSNFTGQMVSAVKGGEVRVEAGRDLALTGSSIDAQGNAALLAGGSIDLLAAQGESHSYWKEKGRRASRTIINDKTGLIGSGVSAGEGVVMAAGRSGAAPGDITLQASSVQAGADVALQADGNIAVLSRNESEYSYFKESHKGFMKKSQKVDESSRVTSVGSLIEGRNVNMQAGENLNVMAGRVSGSNDITLRAGKGDVILGDAEESSYRYSKKTSSGFGLFSGGGSLDVYRSNKEKSSHTEVGSAGSQLTAGNDLKITAGRDVTAINAKIGAGNDLELAAARDVNLLPGRVSQETEYYKKTSGVGFSVSAKGISDFSAFAGYHAAERGGESVGEYNAASALVAGNDLRLSAGENINLLGAAASAGNDLSMTAGNDLNLLSAFDKERTEQYRREVSAGVALQAHQGFTDAARQGLDSLRGSVEANNRGSASTPSAVTLPRAYVRFGAVASNARSDSSAERITPVPGNLTSGGDMTLLAGNDLTMRGSNALALGDLNIGAVNNVTVEAAAEERSASASRKEASGFAGLSLLNFGYDINEIGYSTLTPTGALSAGSSAGQSSRVAYKESRLGGANISVGAGRDLSLSGVTASATVDLNLLAGNNLSITGVTDQFRESSRSGRLGFDVDARAASLGKERSESSRAADRGSKLFADGALSAVAGQDMLLKGALLESRDDLLLSAGRDLLVLPGAVAEESRSGSFNLNFGQEFTLTEQKAALFEGGTLSYAKSSASSFIPYATELRSEGGLILDAGRDLALTGAIVESGREAALQAGRDLALLASEAKSRSSETKLAAKVGLYAEAGQTLTGTVRSVYENAPKTYNQLRDYLDHGFDDLGSVAGIKKAWEDGSRLIGDGMKLADNVKAIADLRNAKVSWGIGAAASADYSRSRREERAQTGVSITSLGDLLLKAGRDIAVQGGQITSASDVSIAAGRDFNAVAAVSESKSSAFNAKASGSFGVGGQIGRDGVVPLGFNLNSGAALARQSSDGIRHTNTGISAGKLLEVASGRDSTLRGANLGGDQVRMDVGGDLTLVSLRDSSRSDNAGINGGFGASLGLGDGFYVPGGYASSRSAAGLNYGDRNAAGVNRQASILGRNEVDIRVGQNTGLEGGLIAAANDNLKLDTGTLTWKDVESTSTEKGFNLSLSYTHKSDAVQAREAEARAAREAKEAERRERYEERMADNLADKLAELRAQGYTGEYPEQNLFTDISKGSIWASAKLSDMNDVIQSIPIKPEKIGVKYMEVEQVARATVGGGQITVRDNPALDISDLNRAPDFSMTKSVKYDLDVSLNTPLDTLDQYIGYAQLAALKSQDVEEYGFMTVVEERIEKGKSELKKGINKLGDVFNSFTDRFKDK